MRWKGVIFILIVLGAIIALSLIFTDIWLEHQLEKVGSSIVGARVEFEDVDFSFIGLHMRWDSLQVTNPKQTMKNILTTGPTEFNMELQPLLRKKVIIENVQMTHVTSGTDRSTDGKIKKKPKPPSKPNILTRTVDRLQADVAQAPAWNLDVPTSINVDSILALLEIKTPNRIDSLQQQLDSTYTHWNNTFTEMDVENDLQQIRDNVESIKPDQIQTIPELQSAYKKADAAVSKLDSLKKFVKATKNELQTDLQTSRQSLTVIDDWVQDDFQRAMAKAQLSSFSARNIAVFLFGNKVVSNGAVILNGINTVRSFSAKLSSGKPEKENPPRFKGQWIPFTGKDMRPRWWIKNIQLSGHTTRGLSLSGSLQHLTSNQRVIQKTTVLDINGERGDGASVKLFSEFDYLGEQPNETFELNLASVPVNNVQLSESRFLPAKLAKGRADVSVGLESSDERVTGSLEVRARQVAFEFAAEPQGRAEELIRKVLQNTNELDISARVTSVESNTRLSLNSNVDDRLVSELRNQVGAQVQEARQRIETRVREETEKQRRRLNQFVDGQSSELNAAVTQLQDQIAAVENEVDAKKKELEARIEEEKQKGSDEVKKRLNDLF